MSYIGKVKMSLERRQVIEGEVTRIQEKTGIALVRILRFAGIPVRTWHEWQGRRGEETKHNSNIPRSYCLTPEEEEAIAEYCEANNEDGLKGYRMLCYEMIDRNVAFASPSSVYNVLHRRNLFKKWAQSTENGNTGKHGFDQPVAVHEQWHIDFSYIKIGEGFYYFIGILDGYSRRMLNWRLCLTMEGINAELLVLETKTMYAEAKTPRIISDNGSQFTSKDFEELLDYLEIRHTCTSPGHPQSNGKLECFHRTWKTEEVRRDALLDYEDAIQQIGYWIEYYNTRRLHSAIWYLTPDDIFYGRKEKRLAERREKLYTANNERQAYWTAQPANA
jgi:transposase InsO family protein